MSLEGKGDELKAYRIGVDVFDRGADFDPRVDPIVRMQAAKLRARLAEYYADEGRDDRLIISIPKGGYAPAFTHVAAKTKSNEIRSIAVLPFVNMSADAENEYFSDGLTEELINSFAAVPGLRVVARTSAFCFKNTTQDVREIGARLNVDTVLEGSVRKSGNQLRVTAQLIEVSSGYHLLSRAYPRELKDVFAMQEELANSVVSEIMPQMRNGRDPFQVRVQAADLTVYNLYLKGMATLSKDFIGPQDSVKIFQEVLRLDPNYAPGAAGLAYAHFVTGCYVLAPSSDAMPSAKKAAETAIRLDPESGLAHVALGAVHGTYEWNWEEAEPRFQTAIKLQPSLALASSLCATLAHLPRRRVQAALSAIEQALELNPFDAMLRASAVHIYSFADNYQAALETTPSGLRSTQTIHSFTEQWDWLISAEAISIKPSQSSRKPSRCRDDPRFRLQP